MKNKKIHISLLVLLFTILAPAMIWVIRLMVMLILLTLSMNKSDRMLQTSETVTTQGVVTHVEKKSSRSGVKYAVTYHYTPDGKTEETKGISYNKSADVIPEQQVLVEYLTKEPSVSRIKGMRSSPVDFIKGVKQKFFKERNDTDVLESRKICLEWVRRMALRLPRQITQPTATTEFLSGTGICSVAREGGISGRFEIKPVRCKGRGASGNAFPGGAWERV